ncbi:MAG: hypothetical protein FJX77_01375 [Armatimonadetes bacterium]|nr:hypothetical protein [Armatimonadota bacterium]
MNSQTVSLEPTGQGSPWRLSPVDGVVAASFLTLALIVSLTTAIHLREQTRRVDHERLERMRRCTNLRQTVKRLELSRQMLARVRRAANQYVVEVEARPVVPWTTVMNEFSRRRPRGLWTVRITGEGPRFKALVSAQRPDLISSYAQQLRESPYIEFAALPSGTGGQGTAQVVGRLMGE